MDALAVIPPEGTIRDMDSMLEPIANKQVVNSLEIRTLAALRDMLLPRLISGELRVGEAEAFVEDTV